MNDTGIMASYYGGGGDEAPSDGDKSNNNKTSSSLVTKEKRKRVERSMTYRLYAVRLIENAYMLEQNESSLRHVLVKLEQQVVSLEHLIGNATAATARVRAHEAAKVYLDEAIILHTNNKSALSISTRQHQPHVTNNNSQQQQKQHAVFTLHERYVEHVARVSTEREVRTALEELEQTYELVSRLHRSLLDLAASCRQPLTTRHLLQLTLAELKSKACSTSSAENTQQLVARSRLVATSSQPPNVNDHTVAVFRFRSDDGNYDIQLL